MLSLRFMPPENFMTGSFARSASPAQSRHDLDAVASGSPPRPA